jgi:ABC-type transport system involved in cytochrome bd biosynthesis fused ATPase/permease subunit
MHNSLDYLYKTVWTTRGCRFAAHRRLEKLDNISTYAINVLSLTITAISIIALAPPHILGFLKLPIGSILTLVLSVSIFVLSIMFSSKGYKLKAEKMHDCGKELSVLYTNIIMAMDPHVSTSKSISELMDSYHAIIAKYDNHSDLDFKVFQAANPTDFTLSKWDRIKIQAELFWHINSVIILPLILMALIISFFYLIK